LTTVKLAIYVVSIINYSSRVLKETYNIGVGKTMLLKLSEKIKTYNLTQRILGTNPKKRFVAFVFLILVGWITGFLAVRRGISLTPETFKNYVLSLGSIGPVIYTAIFIIRPFFLIPSIALFVAGGLAFGPIFGPLYASLGAAFGGTLGFWVARHMGHEYVMSRLKLGARVIEKEQFSFSLVFLLSLLPVMPVTAINYGAGLSRMKFKNYLTAHVLGLTPRAFAYGFFGNALLEIGSPEFRASVLILLLMGFLTVYFRLRSRRTRLSGKIKH